MKEYQTIRELIEDTAKKYKDKNAFIVKKDGKYDCISYLRLEKEIRNLGKCLIAKGFKGKHIAIIGKNSYNWMLVYLSVLSIGSVAVCLDRALSAKDIEFQLNFSDTDLVFYSSDVEKKITVSPGKTFICTDSDDFCNLLKEGDNTFDDDYNNTQADPLALSILIFTSGTTSDPKAVMLSQKNILFDVYQMSIWENFCETDVNLALLPFHHTFGMTQIVIFLSSGMCNVFCEGLRVAKALNEYKVSVLVVVPRILESIYAVIQKKAAAENKTAALRKLSALSNGLKKIKIDLRRFLFKSVLNGLGGNLRMIIVGAAAGDPVILKFFNDMGILTIQGYGLTETSPCISAENHTHMRKKSVGLALPALDVKIIDKDSNGIGEIAVKGDNVMLGYYKNEESTKKVFNDGYFLTGDMGRIDNENYIFITGRKKNVIVLSNGKNVFPEEIEATLVNCNAIKECIVSKGELNGRECLSAKIVYDKNYTYEDAAKIIELYLKNYNENAVSYKHIKDYTLTDIEMEKTTTLKIKR